MLLFVNVIWGARCGKSARRVLLGETRSSGHAYSVRRLRESAIWREAPHRLPSSRLVSTIPFDRWMAANFPGVPFERYADDAIVHCRTERQAQMMRKAITQRLSDCGLELHPEKTQIIYCKDDRRTGRHTHEKFDFLGYEYRPRRARSRVGKVFTSFNPAVSPKAAKAMRDMVRNWRMRNRSDQSIEQLSRLYNPVIRGWFQYYGRFYRSEFYSVVRQLDRELVRWARQKYKKLRFHVRRARHWLAVISRRSPELFAYWSTARSGSTMGAV